MSIRHLEHSAVAQQMVLNALNKFAPEEYINYTTSIVVFPDPSKWDYEADAPMNQAGMVIFLEIFTKDPEITIYASPVVPAFALTQERIDKVVEETLREMKNTRVDAGLTKVEDS